VSVEAPDQPLPPVKSLPLGPVITARGMLAASPATVAHTPTVPTARARAGRVALTSQSSRTDGARTAAINRSEHWRELPRPLNPGERKSTRAGAGARRPG
jgi:hypothetical protein